MITKIKLHNFRSYDLYETDIGEHGTVIVGPNGTGKTNLLEAVYITLRGVSFRGSLIDCVKLNTNQMNLLLETDETTRRVQINREDNISTKLFVVNDSQSKLLAPKNRLPVVLFEPNELRLITSSPSRRRDFLDGLLSRLDPTYEKNLRAFHRTLLQRNELLKQESAKSEIWRDHLFAWDIKYVQTATAIASSRADFFYTYESQLGTLYTSLAGSQADFSIEYQPCVPLVNYEQSLLDRLAKSRDFEIATGHTSTGPHREDFTIYLHGQPAQKVASRGEMRTIMLAFKLLELELQTKLSKTKPIILMDDVFSELDATREQLLQEAIEQHQFIVTTTDARHKRSGSLIVSTTQTR